MVRPSPRDSAWTEFQDLWDRLLEAGAEPGTVLVVEGENDVQSLRRLGVEGRIVPLHIGRRLPRLARDLSVSARRVVLLFDWDAQGGRWARKMRELLEADQVEVDLDLRRRLAGALHGELVHVEGLYRWARRLAEAHGGSLEHFRPDLTGLATPPEDGDADRPTG